MLLRRSPVCEYTTKELEEQASRFHYYMITDLAHLVTLFTHPASDLADVNTALIVIDSISTVFDIAYSQFYDQQSKKQSEIAKWAANRKYAVMGDLISKLKRLATVNDLVVLMTQQTRLRIRSGAGALLLPTLSSIEWDHGVSTQLVLFRDFPPHPMTQPDPELAERWRRLRYAGLIKINGVSAEENGRFETVVPFTIEMHGLSQLPTPRSEVTVPVLSSPVRIGKRRFEEIADSEDEALPSDDEYNYGDVDFEDGLFNLTKAP
ncbi:hypothetical protein, variant [Verruconis gallopava]|nr:hypothetical protein, variant [Verruconis gallopava]KIW05954.1 hypothetical protein, variant [Verruconis gallopava]